MAKPRIFISSTYYDLRYVREALKNFINLYDFESILNEFGRVTYKHNYSLDKSCFDEVKNSDMLILIVGGRYGSSITQNGKINYSFYDEYTSITSEEFRTAYANNIPIYIFIESNVESEYYTYTKNLENNTISYAHVDSVNILKFIYDLKNEFSNNVIFTFHNIADITDILRSQWAGLFHSLLKEKKEKSEATKVKDSIEKLNLLTDNINSMITAVGKNILKDNDDFIDILNKQKMNSLKYIVKTMVNEIEFEGEKITKEEAEIIVKIYYDEFLNNDFYKVFRDKNSGEKFSREERRKVEEYHANTTKEEINKKIKDKITAKVIEYVHSKYNSTFILFNNDILPMIEEDKKMEEYFLEYLAIEFYKKQH